MLNEFISYLQSRRHIVRQQLYNLVFCSLLGSAVQVAAELFELSLSRLQELFVAVACECLEQSCR
jgi:hypothetical protein